MGLNRIPSKSLFRDVAEPCKCMIGPQAFYAAPKLFSTGSYGWHASGKVPVDLSGEQVLCQVSMSIVVIGSKDKPVGESTDSPPPESTPDSLFRTAAVREELGESKPAHVVPLVTPIEPSVGLKDDADDGKVAGGLEAAWKVLTGKPGNRKAGKARKGGGK